MVCLQPRKDMAPEFGGKRAQFIGLRRADAAGGVILGGVAFGAAGVEIVGVVRAFGSEYQGEGLQRAVMGEPVLRAESRGVEQDRAKL